MSLTAIAVSSFLINPPINKHILLLYDNQAALESLIAEHINEGLKSGQLCVFGSIHLRDHEFIESFSSLIVDYKENVKKGNLLIIDLAPFYISAVMGDMTPFENAKKMLAEKVGHRSDKRIRFVGDGAGFLFKNRHFEECAILEQWWQEKPFEGTYVCPYLRSSLDGHYHALHAKRAVMAAHDIVINISETPLSGDLYKHQEAHVIESKEQTTRVSKNALWRSELG